MKEFLVMLAIVGAFLAGCILTDIGRDRMEAKVEATVREAVSRLAPDPEPQHQVEPPATYNVILPDDDEPLPVVKEVPPPAPVSNCRPEIRALGLCK